MITVKDAKFRLFYRGYYIEFGLYGMNEYTVQIDGDSCHVAAPRGSKTGTQALNKTEKAMYPKKLCEHIVDICEEIVE